MNSAAADPAKDMRLLRAALCIAGIPRKKAGAALQENGAAIPDLQEKLKGAGRYLEDLSGRGIRFLIPEDKDWPLRFSALSDPPQWLFVRGMLPPEDMPTAAVIGCRNASVYGLRMAEYIAGELARNGVGIVSGMAAGIDGAAQMAAATAGGVTFGVLGFGVNLCYPAENYELFSDLSEGKGGGILSEYLPDSEPLKWHFPERNRLIAALGDQLVVIESRGPKSGSQITVNCALDQGRTIFAVPGRITDPLSRGCNDLIRDGAAILTSPRDILDHIGLRSCGRLPAEERGTGSLSPEEQLVLSMLTEKPCLPDAILRKTGLPAGKIMSILLDLELRGLILQTSPNYFALS